MDFIGTLLHELKTLPKCWWLWLIITAMVAGMIAIFWMKRKGQKTDKGKVLSISLLAAYILFILFETIVGREANVFSAKYKLFWSYGIPELRTEIIMNYILFIPFGVLLYLSIKRIGMSILVGILTSCVIEIYQLCFHVGLFEFDDIWGNTVGCLIGVILGSIAVHIIKKS